MQLTDSDFTRLYTYVKNSYGIDLSKKKQLISSRLNNMLIQQGYRVLPSTPTRSFRQKIRKWSLPC